MKKNNSGDSILVYSSGVGRICRGCGKPSGECTCGKRETVPSDGIVRIRRETKGRGGKTVTVISGLGLEDRLLKDLASDLKRRCGTGGAAKEGSIEIQGDHRESLKTELERRGFKVKFAGG
jgi:translation initiation factor 1